MEGGGEREYVGGASPEGPTGGSDGADGGHVELGDDGGQ